jgi:hypothetical protein
MEENYKRIVQEIRAGRAGGEHVGGGNGGSVEGGDGSGSGDSPPAPEEG